MFSKWYLGKVMDIMINEDVSYAEANEIFKERIEKKSAEVGHEVGSFLFFFISNLKVVFCMR